MLHMQRLVRQAVVGLTHRRQHAAWLAWRAACEAAVRVQDGAAQLQLRVVQRLQNQVCRPLAQTDIICPDVIWSIASCNLIACRVAKPSAVHKSPLRKGMKVSTVLCMGLAMVTADLMVISRRRNLQNMDRNCVRCFCVR